MRNYLHYTQTNVQNLSRWTCQLPYHSRLDYDREIDVWTNCNV